MTYEIRDVEWRVDVDVSVALCCVEWLDGLGGYGWGKENIENKEKGKATT